MKIYNTLTRKLEDFKTIESEHIRFYHCGPTVYWTQHIGNLRGMTMADLIRRTLIYLGYKIKFVRNYTDVGHLTSDADTGEDKMETGVKREGLSPQAIAEKYIKIFEDDCRKLNILKPDLTPRASEYIASIIDFIQILLDKGYAYHTQQAIYYDVSKFKNYNQLNRQQIGYNQQGRGKGEVFDLQKKHFIDFALWFFKTGVHKNALQTWDSPWGRGFPGWHIECSVMAKELLGKTLDIHMGGIEHIAIHHTNEIAQSEAANGVRFVNYWLHNEHLKVNSKKMAKSDATGIVLDQVINQGFSPLDLRYFFLTSHYRSQQNFTWEALDNAKKARLNLNNKIKELLNSSTKKGLVNEEYKNRFIAAVSLDFNIPQALAITWESLKSNLSADDKLATIINFDKILGLNLAQLQLDFIPNQIHALAQKRLTAKMKKDFTTADKIRQEIVKQGYLIEDTPDGYTLKKSSS